MEKKHEATTEHKNQPATRQLDTSAVTFCHRLSTHQTHQTHRNPSKDCDCHGKIHQQHTTFPNSAVEFPERCPIHYNIQSTTISDEAPSKLTILHAPRRAETANMSLTNCRFYEEKYPEIDSFVMVNVKQVRHFSARR
jgi:hypothetical protein